MGCFVWGGKNGMGYIVRGDKNCMGYFVRGGKTMQDVLSGWQKMAWDVLSRGFVLHSKYSCVLAYMPDKQKSINSNNHNAYSRFWSW